MDYYHNTSASDAKSTHPNQHDYDELVSIYTPLDSSTTIGSAPATLPQEIVNGDFSSPNSWGKLMSSEHGASTYVRDFGNSNQVVTYVIWTEE